MTLIKLIKKKTYVKDEKTYHYVNYYLKLENGQYVCVKPTFASDYVKFDTIAIIVKE